MSNQDIHTIDHLTETPSITRLYDFYTTPSHASDDFFLHARLFKTPPYSDVLTAGEYSFSSSGTSGTPTVVRFNRTDSIEQQRNLLNILPAFIPYHRKESVLICINVDNANHNARLAAARGFSLLSKHVIYLSLDYDVIIHNIEHYLGLGKHVYLFSFTYDLFTFLTHLAKNLMSFPSSNQLSAIHGGGWKTHQSESIDSATFRTLFNQCFPNATLMNYYGMIEQLGNIYPSCQYDLHHVTLYNDIIIRDKYMNPSPINEEGIIQVISKLPTKQTNTSILTEDLGVIVTTKCKCGRPGKAFKVLGRLQHSQIRGCSNAYL